MNNTKQKTAKPLLPSFIIYLKKYELFLYLLWGHACQHLDIWTTKIFTGGFQLTNRYISVQENLFNFV